MPLDVTDQSASDAVAQTPLGRNVSILVNNAGIGHVGTILQTTSQDLDRLWAVNVRGVFNICRSFLPAMLARRSGSIVNIASVGGVVGIRDRIAYCTTKFAVVGLTKCLALDHATDGIRDNAICPGRVETPFVQARLKEYPIPKRRIARCPPRRLSVGWESPRRLPPPRCIWLATKPRLSPEAA